MGALNLLFAPGAIKSRYGPAVDMVVDYALIAAAWGRLYECTFALGYFVVHSRPVTRGGKPLENFSPGKIRWT